MKVHITFNGTPRETATLDVDFSSLDEFAEYLSFNAFFMARCYGSTGIYRSSLVDFATEVIGDDDE